MPHSGPTSSPARTSLQQLQSHSHPHPHPTATPLPGKRASPVTTALIKAQEDASCWKTRVKACSSRHHHHAISSPHHDHVAPVVLGEGGGGGSCLYPGSPLPLARWVRGRVLGRPPTNRGLKGTPSLLPGECPDGAVPMSLSPGERQTDRRRGDVEQGENKSRACGDPCHRPAACHRERGPQSISRACGGTVKGHVWVSPLCQSLGTFSLRGGVCVSSSPSCCIPSPPSPIPYQDPASPQPQHPHGPAAGGRGWAVRVQRHPPPGVAAAGWTPAACPCPSGCFAARWASCSPSSWHPRKPPTPPRC